MKGNILGLGAAQKLPNEYGNSARNGLKGRKVKFHSISSTILKKGVGRLVFGSTMSQMSIDPYKGGGE